MEFAELNTRLDRVFERFGRAATEIETLIQGVDKLATNQERLQTDLDALQVKVETNSNAITALGSAIAADTADKAALRQEIADLKAANPDIDLTNLESISGSLDANNNQAAQILAAVQPA